LENSEQRVTLDDIGAVAEIFGKHDEHLARLEEAFNVRIVARDGVILIKGDPEGARQAREIFEELKNYYYAGNHITLHEVNYAIKTVKSGKAKALTSLAEDVIMVTHRGKRIKPKTLGQQRYVRDIERYDMVFAIGPAGTGKTYLAVVMAVRALKNKEINRIVLTRPAVEAGEKLGFLPGDLQEKVDPYLRPLYDSLYDILGVEITQKYIDRRIIEIAPLAYMRGRTLEDSFIILDEAQNTTSEQMKMFLTRLGFDSKAVITGDITQVDLPKGETSGLINARKVLGAVPGISFCTLTEADVVRHPLVQEIIKAYEVEHSER